jgi:hypothetical protein
MRWTALFDDLEAQVVQLDHAARAAEVEERTRGEIAALTMWDRARGSIGVPVALRLDGGAAASGTLARVGRDWWLLDAGAGREVLVPTARLAGVAGLGRGTATPGTAAAVEARIGLRQLLRAVARDRSEVRVELTDGTAVAGTLDRVGGDFVDLAAHPAGEPRRRREVREVQLIPLAAIVAVRRSA